jgi:hypothetical protein
MGLSLEEIQKMGPEDFIGLWDATIDKMVRFHDNIGTEVQQLIIAIQKTRDGEGTTMVQGTCEKAALGKKIKADIRAMWSLEYEIEQLQEDFSKQMGSIDIKALTDDFIEDMLLQSKPLQSILAAIRSRQREKLANIKKEYDEHVDSLEPLYIQRPPKPIPPPKEEPKPAEPVPAAVDAPAPAAVTA